MKQILITCDTEIGELTINSPDAFDVFINGNVAGESVGYNLINKIANKYSAKVTHFIDIYSCIYNDDKKYIDLCNKILSSGNDIALHTHPSKLYDKHRRYMFQYSLNEQIEIIEFGKTKLFEWTGVIIIGHRSGGYGSDNNTMKALRKNDIQFDCSFFANNPMCKIKAFNVNKFFSINGVTQLPVTVFKKKIMSFPGKIEKYLFQKLDFRYGATVEDILYTINEMPQSSIIVLFLHSFNFLKLRYNFKKKSFSKISINQSLINSFDRLLNGISIMNECEFRTLDTIKLDNTLEDVVPEVLIKKSIADSFKHKIHKLIGVLYI